MKPVVLDLDQIREALVSQAWEDDGSHEAITVPVVMKVLESSSVPLEYPGRAVIPVGGLEDDARRKKYAEGHQILGKIHLVHDLIASLGQVEKGGD